MLAQLHAIFIVIIVLGLVIRRYRNRGLPQVGGTLGRRMGSADLPVPDGFAGVERRAAMLAVASGDAKDYANLRAYLTGGTTNQPATLLIYHIPHCRTRVEIADAAPNYERIAPSEALALLRELVDLRFIDRLHLRDEPSYLDPWLRKASGRDLFLLGNATYSRLVVLNRPDRRLGQLVGLTLLHEWLHLVAFASPKDLKRFERANRIEALAAPQIAPTSFGIPKTALHEAWADLGEALWGYDAATARKAALDAPVHALILWRRVERLARKTPARLRSTRHAEFAARSAFMRREIVPRAAAVRARRNRLRRAWRWLRRVVL